MTSELNAIRTDIVENYAIKNHASAYETYGVGTSSLYGHLKLSDVRNANLTEEFGTAATPKAINDTYNDLVELIDGFNIDNEFNDIKNALVQINDTTIPDGQDIVISNIRIISLFISFHPPIIPGHTLSCPPTLHYNYDKI